MASRRRPNTANSVRNGPVPKSFTSRLATFRQTHLVNGEPISYNTQNEGLHPAPWLAQQGLYYTPLSLRRSHAVTCSTCETVISQPLLRSDDVAQVHLNQSPSCQIAQIWKYRTSKDKSDVDFFKDPLSEKGRSVRESTFTKNGLWIHKFPDIRTMVESGLYYDPLSEVQREDGSVELDDRVICMYCGLNLEQWELDDDVEMAHRDANPSCDVFRIAGIEFQLQNGLSEEIRNVSVEKDVTNQGYDEMMPDFEANIPYDDNAKVNLGDDDDHSVLSIVSATTTTTTTTALPVEIVEVDEVEEYLLQDDRRDAVSRDIATVEIPSVKSSELSHFFTEMDLESERDAGASFFGARKKQRDAERQTELEQVEEVEKHDEQEEPELVQSALDDVPQEAEKEVSEQISQPALDNSQSPDTQLDNYDGKSVPSPPLDEQKTGRTDQVSPKIQEIRNSTSFTENDEQNFQDGFDAKVEHDGDHLSYNDFEVNHEDFSPFQPQAFQDSLVGNVNNDNDNIPKETVDGKDEHRSDQNEKLPNNDTISNLEKEKESEKQKEREAELSRVEQLESELKLLKLQIERLQSQAISTNIPQPKVFKQAQQEINEPHLTSEKEEPNGEIGSKSKSEENNDSDQVGDGNVSGHKIIADEAEDKREDLGATSIVSNGIENLGAGVNESSLIETEIKVEGEIESPRIVIKKENVDESLLPSEANLKDNNKRIKEKKGIKKKLKKASKKRDYDDVDDIEDDPLSFKSKKARIKNKPPAVEKDHILPVPVKKLPETIIKNEPEVSVTPENRDDSEIVARHETSEVPTEADQSGQINEANESNNRNFLLEGFVQQAKHITDDRSIGTEKEQMKDIPTGSENDESYNDTSPTLLRKARAMVGQRKIQEKVLNENPGHAFQLDLGLNLQNEGIADNQSTPYAATVKDVLGMSANDSHVEAVSVNIPPPGVREDEKHPQLWKPLDTRKCLAVHDDVKEAVGYVKEVLDSPYGLLGDDLDGLLTEFVGAIPPEQLEMTVREWMRCQEEQAVALVEEKAAVLQEQFRAARAAAEAYIQTL